MRGKWGSCMIRIPDLWKQIFGSGNQVFGLFCFGWSLIRPRFPPCSGCCWIADESVRASRGHLAEALWEPEHPKRDWFHWVLPDFPTFSVLEYHLSDAIFQWLLDTSGDLQTKSAARFSHCGFICSSVFRSRCGIFLKRPLGWAGSCGVDVWVSENVSELFHSDTVQAPSVPRMSGLGDVIFRNCWRLDAKKCKLSTPENLQQDPVKDW